MSMSDLMPADASAPVAPAGNAGEKRYAQAIAALELASGSPEAIAAADGADSFSVSFSGDDAVVSVGDVDVNVSADQIAGEVGEEMTEIDDMPDPSAVTS